MKLVRIWRHIVMTEFHVQRTFPQKVLDAIKDTIRRCEETHRGEIRFVVERELSWGRLLADMSARARALEVFSALRVWDTEENNGVLVYVLLADRRVEIVADRGIHASVANDGWRAISGIMEREFRTGNFAAGATRGIDAISEHLRRHFPANSKPRNELPDAPLVM